MGLMPYYEDRGSLARWPTTNGVHQLIGKGCVLSLAPPVPELVRIELRTGFEFRTRQTSVGHGTCNRSRSLGNMLVLTVANGS